MESGSTLSVSVVIPTYNEVSSIQQLLPELSEALERHGVSYEVIVVDDQSTDGTPEAVRSLQETIPSLRLCVRQGARSLARSWHEGYRLAGGNVVATMDADLCHSPQDLIRLLDAVKTTDIVIGSRYTAQGTMPHKSRSAALGSKISQRLTRLVTGLQLTDISHSFRVFRREVFTSLEPHLQQEGNVYMIAFLTQAAALGYTIDEIPITYGARKHGQSKLRLWQEGQRYLRFLVRQAALRLRS